MKTQLSASEAALKRRDREISRLSSMLEQATAKGGGEPGLHTDRAQRLVTQQLNSQVDLLNHELALREASLFKLQDELRQSELHEAASARKQIKLLRSASQVMKRV